jgi:hypothetical protein
MLGALLDEESKQLNSLESLMVRPRSLSILFLVTFLPFGWLWLTGHQIIIRSTKLLFLVFLNTHYALENNFEKVVPAEPRVLFKNILEESNIYCSC